MVTNFSRTLVAGVGSLLCVVGCGKPREATPSAPLPAHRDAAPSELPAEVSSAVKFMAARVADLKPGQTKDVIGLREDLDHGSVAIPIKAVWDGLDNLAKLSKEVDTLAEPPVGEKPTYEAPTYDPPKSEEVSAEDDSFLAGGDRSLYGFFREGSREAHRQWLEDMKEYRKSYAESVKEAKKKHQEALDSWKKQRAAHDAWKKDKSKAKRYTDAVDNFTKSRDELAHKLERIAGTGQVRP